MDIISIDNSSKKPRDLSCPAIWRNRPFSSPVLLILILSDSVLAMAIATVVTSGLRKQSWHRDFFKKIPNHFHNHIGGGKYYNYELRFSFVKTFIGEGY